MNTSPMTTDQLNAELDTVKRALVRLIDANTFAEPWNPHLGGALMVLVDAVRCVQERYGQLRDSA